MKWVLAETDEGAAALLSKGAGLHPLIAKLMVNRRLTDPSKVRSFLACDLSTLSGPGIFSGMEKAVARIRKAVTDRQKITIYGDYDVDGVTASALLCSTLERMGADVVCYIPDRLTEGYGLNTGALEAIYASGSKLVITVDCGIGAAREALHAVTVGLDLIITDHHELDSSGRFTNPESPGGFNLPDAFAVLHPLLLTPDVPAEIREQVSCLTGVGVAFKLAQALLDTDIHDERLLSCLDLVTLGTVADVGRITGENRILVKHGLAVLSSDSDEQRPGIAALKEVAGLIGKKITVGTVGFSLAPRINAGGRLERAEPAFRLLTTGSREEARTLAGELDTVNRERRSVEDSIWEDARQQCRKTDLDVTGALVLSSEDWHPGVIGIVASRIADEFYRPTALISVKDGIGKGSARSIPGFDLYQGLVACSDLLLGFGGHKYAAGFTLARNNIPRFSERLSSLVRERIGADGFVRTLTVDGAVAFDELTMELLQELETLAPFGQGNPEPKLGARELEVISSRVVGNNHLKLRLRQAGGTTLGAIAFNRGSLLGKQVRDGAFLAAVFTPRLNVWNGKTSIELDIRDIKTEKQSNPKMSETK